MRKRVVCAVAVLALLCAAWASGGQLGPPADLAALTKALEKPLALLQGKTPVFTAIFTPSVAMEELGQMAELRIVSPGGGRFGVVLSAPVIGFELVRDVESTRLVVPGRKMALVGTGPLPAESDLAPGTLVPRVVAGWPEVHSIVEVLRTADAAAAALLFQFFLQLERVPAADRGGPTFRAKKRVSGGHFVIELTPDGTALQSLGWEDGATKAKMGISILDTARMPLASTDGLKVLPVPRAELERAIGRGLARASGILHYNGRGPKPRDKTVYEGAGRLVVKDGRRVAMLQGSPYEIGFQHGRLLAREARRVAEALLYVVGLYNSVEKGAWFLDRIRGALERLQPHIPAEYLEEMRGLAEGAKMPLETVLLANVFPALFHCSGFALYGKATAGGKLYHGRVLDYMTEVGLQRDAVVFVVKKKDSIPFANVGYAGFIGSVSGMNSSGVAIGEMGGGGEGLWDGTPMPILMRMALERGGTLEDACGVFREAKRTCEYFYVVSDAKGPSAVGIAATPERIDFLRPGQPYQNLPTPLEDCVLLSAGSRYRALVERVRAEYGQIEARVARNLMRRPVAMESNLHNVLFVPQDLVFHVADARRREPAAERPYARYELKSLLAEMAKPPAEE